MTYPSADVGTTNLDDGATDQPKLARADLLDLVQKFNELRNHISVYMRGMLDDADAATARATLGLSLPLGVSSGGHGQTTASAGFAALKQAATSSETGVVELATTAEMQIGTDSTRVPSVADIHASVLGNRHTLTNMSGSRFLATLHNNSTGRPIVVMVNAGSNATHHIIVQIDGVEAIKVLGSATSSPQARNVTFIVPNGSTYYVYADAGTPYLVSWLELR